MYPMHELMDTRVCQIMNLCPCLRVLRFPLFRLLSVWLCNFSEPQSSSIWLQIKSSFNLALYVCRGPAADARSLCHIPLSLNSITIYRSGMQSFGNAVYYLCSLFLNLWLSLSLSSLSVSVCMSASLPCMSASASLSISNSPQLSLNIRYERTRGNAQKLRGTEKEAQQNSESYTLRPVCNIQTCSLNEESDSGSDG